MSRKKFYVVFVILFFTAVMIIYVSSIRQVKASDGIYREKCVSTVKVVEGDTIWSIACAYYTSEYKDINELVKEIKRSNRIDEDIFIGQHIIIPHYEKIS